jgi:hypothetical protein
MAQESGQTQTVIRRPYRFTEAGGFDKTWVFTYNGDVVKPAIKQRSRTGRHGWDVWYLEPGKYVVISVSRPNIHNGAKPYSVTMQCIEVSNGGVKKVASRTMYMMDYSISDLKEWAKAVCP